MGRLGYVLETVYFTVVPFACLGGPAGSSNWPVARFLMVDRAVQVVQGRGEEAGQLDAGNHRAAPAGDHH